jgi:hypothetical protein
VRLPDLPIPDETQDGDELVQETAELRFMLLIKRVGGPWKPIKHADLGAAYSENGLLHQLDLEAPLGAARAEVWRLKASVVPQGSNLATGAFVGVLFVGLFAVIYLVHDVWKLPGWTMLAGFALTMFAAFAVSGFVLRFTTSGRDRPALDELERKLTASLGPDVGIIASENSGT